MDHMMVHNPAYEVAGTHDCPLLYVGADFARTDIASVS